MPTKRHKLGWQLLGALEAATNLMATTTNPERLERLEETRKKLRAQLAKLVDEHLDDQSKQYKDATAGLRDASQRAHAAVKGVESLAKAMQALVRAARLAAKLG